MTVKKNDVFVGEPGDKRLIVQMHKDMWEKLRRLAFELNISMAELCRDGISTVLEKHKKTLAKVK